MTSGYLDSTPWMTRYNDIVPELRNESDRAAALLLASFLERIFFERLRTFFVEDTQVDDLFVGYGPLTSLSAKSDIAYALGFLTRDMKSDLRMVRKIRNHFAHHPAHTTFLDSPVREFCAELTTAKGIKMEDGKLFRQDQPRDQYLFAAIILLTYFDRFVSVQPRRAVPGSPSR